MFVVYGVYQLFRLIEFVYIFVIFTLFAWVLLTFDSTEMSSDEKLVSVDFEVFGRVQGVFFRKYTEQQAKRLGLRGWCMNTVQDTVKGVIEGSPSKVAEMKQWLERTGSPQSRIDRAVFSKEKDIGKFSYDSFKIKR
ncbi:acylphosphatase-1-like [Anoplophora glabripennis]|uniref:acylphosphatase-1-like n=1 Tax=Anoplophora glabripennis TaxID=217634 RepID=UPI0008739180|nr:acylphosphatase-1-like [Anoplophora glabripennis]